MHFDALHLCLFVKVFFPLVLPPLSLSVCLPGLGCYVWLEWQLTSSQSATKGLSVRVRSKGSWGHPVKVSDKHTVQPGWGEGRWNSEHVSRIRDYTRSRPCLVRHELPLSCPVRLSSHIRVRSKKRRCFFIFFYWAVHSTGPLNAEFIKREWHLTNHVFIFDNMTACKQVSNAMTTLVRNELVSNGRPDSLLK